MPRREELVQDEEINNDMELETETDDRINNNDKDTNNKDTGSFTEGFNNQQFKSTDKVTPKQGVNQQ